MIMKPILFNTEMVQANLDGRKTATRRIMNPQPHTECYNGGVHEFVTDDFGLKFKCSGFVCRKCGYGVSPPHSKYPVGTSFIRPKYQPGDILYVRETWAQCPDLFGKFPGYIYRADYAENDLKMDDNSAEVYSDFPACVKWRPSIHMPKDAARLFLRVTDVRVERLQDIDDDGAKAEGANWRNGKYIGFEEKMRHPAVDRFIEIWDSTIKPADREKYGWDANPWVWVIEYERISKEDAGESDESMACQRNG